MKNIIWLLVPLAVLFASEAQAFRFSPIYATLTADGKDKSASFTVENTQGSKIAVQLSVVRRQEDIEGNETNPPAKELFSLYPDQLILEPGQTRTVRLTWLGKEKSDAEIPFRLLATQLEVEGLEKKAPNKKAQIKVLMAYRASVYVTPSAAAQLTGDVVVEDTKVTKDPKGNAKLDMTFFNKGKRHQVLLEPELEISFKDNSGKDSILKLDGKDLEAMTENNILPGGKRHYELPWKKDVPPGPITVVLKAKNEE